MSGRTECGKPSVTIAHRGIFTPTPALSRNPSIPILHTSRRLITVTSRRTLSLSLSPFKTMPGLPGARTRTLALFHSVSARSASCCTVGKSLGRCRGVERGTARKKIARPRAIVADLASFTIATCFVTEYTFEETFTERGIARFTDKLISSVCTYTWWFMGCASRVSQISRSHRGSCVFLRKNCSSVFDANAFRMF